MPARSHKFCVGAAAALLVAAALPLRAGDWPQWGGTNERNMVSDEKGLPAIVAGGKKVAGSDQLDLSGAQNVKWVARLGVKTFGTPTVANGRVLVGSNGCAEDPRYGGNHGAVICFDAATGKFLWELCSPQDTANKNLTYGSKLGICCPCTIDGGRAYVYGYRADLLCLALAGWTPGIVPLSTSSGQAAPGITPGGAPPSTGSGQAAPGMFKDEAQYVVGPGKPPAALTKADGAIIWRYGLPDELHIYPHDACASAPLIVGDLIYVGTGNGVNMGHKVSDTPRAASLIALDKRSGGLVARDDQLIGEHVFHGQWSSPSLGTVNGKPLVLFGAGDGYCYAFDPTPVVKPGAPVGTLRTVWRFDANAGNTGRYKTKDGPSEIIATPVCHNGKVYVAVGQDWTHGKGNGLLSCIDASGEGDISKTGKVWSYDGIGRSISTVAIADGLLYVADVGGKLHCLDAETGKVYWVYEGKDPFWCSPLVADGKVYIGSNAGRLLILAHAKQLKVLCEANLGDPIAGAPVAAGGTLYVATYTHLYAFADKAKP